MDTATYIILRVKGAPISSGYAPNLGPNWRGEAFAKAASGEAEVTVETVELDERGVREMHHDPEVGTRGTYAIYASTTGPSYVRCWFCEYKAGQTDFTWGVQVTGTLESPYTGQGVTDGRCWIRASMLHMRHLKKSLWLERFHR